MCVCAGAAPTERRLLRIGILTLGVLCITQATLNISLRLARKLRATVFCLTALTVLCFPSGAFCYHNPQFLLRASLFKGRYGSVPFQQLRNSRRVPEWPVSTEFNPVMFLLQQSAEKTIEGISGHGNRERPLTREAQSTDWRQNDIYWSRVWIWFTGWI